MLCGDAPALNTASNELINSAKTLVQRRVLPGWDYNTTMTTKQNGEDISKDTGFAKTFIFYSTH